MIIVLIKLLVQVQSRKRGQNNDTGKLCAALLQILANQMPFPAASM